MIITQTLATVADRRSGRGLSILKDERIDARASWAELYEDAGRVAGVLATLGVQPGERVALALPTSLDFARAFFGILAAGAVPVPVPPPFRFASIKIHMKRIALALDQSKVRFVLSDAELAELLGGELGEAFEVVTVSRDAQPRYVNVDNDAPALVQYTSGTVGDPKGVVLSHGNLLANVHAIGSGLGVTDADVCCSWLPLFHDMGLIGTLLTAAVYDVETYMIPPEGFLRDPGRWIRMISRYRGTIATAPSSGYLQALRRIPAESVADLDLSSWRLALNGAENVDTDVLRRFAAHFEPAGFAPTSFLPVYGLAEATLAVAFPPAGRGVKTTWVRRDLLSEGAVAFTSSGAELAREIASVGTAVAGAGIRLLDGEERIVTETATIGEIQVSGDSVMSGYEGYPPVGEWVSTGDLGFWHSGELFICGRKKEMIIINGQNYYASDVETIVGQVPGIYVHGALATSVATADGEALVLFVETALRAEQDRDALINDVRLAVSGALGISPREVLLVPKGKLPRTSSGKLRRTPITTS